MITNELEKREAERKGSDRVSAGKKRSKVTLDEEKNVLHIEYSVGRKKLKEDFELIAEADIGEVPDVIELASFDPQRYWSLFYHRDGKVFSK